MWDDDDDDDSYDWLIDDEIVAADRGDYNIEVVGVIVEIVV
jgi:hypothetical protein